MHPICRQALPPAKQRLQERPVQNLPSCTQGAPPRPLDVPHPLQPGLSVSAPSSGTEGIRHPLCLGGCAKTVLRQSWQVPQPIAWRVSKLQWVAWAAASNLTQATHCSLKTIQATCALTRPTGACEQGRPWPARHCQLQQGKPPAWLTRARCLCEAVRNPWQPHLHHLPPACHAVLLRNPTPSLDTDVPPPGDRCVQLHSLTHPGHQRGCRRGRQRSRGITWRSKRLSSGPVADPRMSVDSTTITSVADSMAGMPSSLSDSICGRFSASP